MLLNSSIIDDINEKQISEILLDVGIFIIEGERTRDGIYGQANVKRFLQVSGFGYLSEQKGIRFNLF